MPSSPPRRQLHGYVSTSARDGWYRFAEANDTNVTALLEAVGQVLAQHDVKAERQLPAWLRQVVRDAQLIASGRSSRKRD